MEEEEDTYCKEVILFSAVFDGEWWKKEKSSNIVLFYRAGHDIGLSVDIQSI